MGPDRTLIRAQAFSPACLCSAWYEAGVTTRKGRFNRIPGQASTKTFSLDRLYIQWPDENLLALRQARKFLSVACFQ